MYNSDMRNTLCDNNALHSVPSVGYQMRRQSECKCEKDIDSRRRNWGLTDYPLASVYAPLQEFNDIYDIENALIRGTIFKELDLPFICGGMTGGPDNG